MTALVLRRHLTPLLIVAVAAPSAVAATPRPPAGRPGAPTWTLSDERTITRWAHVARQAPIHARPGARTRRVSRLRLRTEDGFPEVYLLLRLHRNAAGNRWVELRIPMRPNGRVGWVRRAALGRFHTTRDLLVVDRRRLHMTYFTGGRRRWSAPVGVGRSDTPTPAGRFWIRERFEVSDARSGYWPYAFGTAGYSSLSDWPGGGVIGIHGPYFEPQAIPGRPSHGCIRLRTGDAAWLGHHLHVGTPLRVL